MKNPISKFLLGCSLAFGALSAHAQGLEQIVVEQYYEASAADAAASEFGSADAVPELVAGSKTYRIYVDLAAGFKLETVFGNAAHPLNIGTTTFFYNQTDRGTVFGHTNVTGRLDENTCSIDSYLTFGMAGSTKRGVLKSADADATAVIFPNSEGSPVMENATPWMGTALTSADGMATGTLLTTQTIGLTSTTAFSDNATALFSTNNGAWFVLGGAQGEDPNGTNRILIAQVTTNGTLSFNLNMRVSPLAGGSFVDYVSSNPTGAEATIPSLTFPIALPPDCNGVPGGPAVPGTACDDGLATTGNDVYDANCVCAGQLIDCLGVPGGTAVIGSACDDGNANTGNDVYGANCVCAGQLIDCLGVPGGTAVIGSACNDGNANTGNDVYGANCVCAGQLIDCLGVPGGTAVIGSACNDGNANTGNDVYGANCVCAGQVIDCLGVPGGTAVIGSACDDGLATTGNDVYGANCVCAGTLANDCLGVPGGPAQPGTACDDGNANTGNDVYSANCVCAGQLIDCLGVPGGTAVIGSACDDGNANTGNDVYGANCVCAGQLIDCLGVPGGTAVIGSACNDGNANTGNDVYGANCVCAGQLIDCLGVPGGTAVIGSTCDDGNANTTNDVYGANCVCAGTGLPIDCLGVPGGTAVIGSACDDGNANTIGDVYGANCVCAGINPNCTEDLVLTITLDAFGSQTTWEVRDQTTNTVVANGGPYTDGTPGAVLENICVAAGCYQLTVTDADGISGGGYVLTDDLGRRIIDANGDFTGSSSVVVQGEGDFCVPITGTFVKPNWCDRTDLVSSSFIYCQGVAGATGYQFWFFNSHGTYSRRILKPTTACRLDFAQLPIPLNTALNVRVRALVGGNYAPFGKACRLEVVGGGAFRDLDASELDAPVLNMYPNPNREEVLYLSIEGLSDENLTANVEIFDAMGKRVSAEQVSVADGTMNHIVNLDADMHAGMYFVHVSVDGQVFTERLMRQ